MRAEPQLKPPGTDLRSGSTNPYDIQLLASTLSVVKSKEGEGKKKTPALTDTLGTWLSPKRENVFTLKGGGEMLNYCKKTKNQKKLPMA